jgi:hypothetical protein
MEGKLSRKKLVDLVSKIMNSEGTEEEIHQWVNTLRANVPHPAVSDLIFYPERKLTAEEIVDEALSYQPIPLPGKKK